MHLRVKLVVGFAVLVMASLSAHADYDSPSKKLSHNLEQLIIGCVAQVMIIDAIEEVGLNSEPLVHILPPECSAVCSDAAECFTEENEALRGSLPRVITKTRTYNRYGFRFTFQIVVYVYRCGESVCLKVLSLKRRCGGQCWYPLTMPPSFYLPIEVYPEQNGWSCSELAVQEDPYEEVRSCRHEDGTICVTADWETLCWKDGRLVDEPQDLPPLDPGYNAPPAPEESSLIYAHEEARPLVR